MRTLFFLLLSGITSFAVADQDAMQKLNALLADPAAQQQAYAAGHERITFANTATVKTATVSVITFLI